MEYTTHNERLILPEYGRNVQRMVDYAVTIEDREERTRCAHTIIDIMGNLFPYLRDVDDFKHKLWDHIAIMSDFKLDIDFPYEIVKKEELNTRPEPIPYNDTKIRNQHYGRHLEELIHIASDYPEGEERDHLVELIANQMKKNFLAWNKEIARDDKIFEDLRELSNGKIDYSSDSIRLMQSKQLLSSRRTQQSPRGGKR